MTTKRRIAVDLPRELASNVSALAAGRGTLAAHLWHHWVLVAARLAADGQGDLLPQRRRAPRGTAPKDLLPVFWTQGPGEYTRCKELIEAAGSSVTVVLRAAGQAYVDAGGDPVAMTWPPKSLAALAA